MRLTLLLLSALFIISSAATAYAEPMKFVYYDQYAPRSFKEDGKMKGIIIDVIDEIIADTMKIPVTHEGYPWSRAQAMVKSGQADAFVTVPTAERREYAVVSKKPIFTFEAFVATIKTSKKLEQLRNVTSLEDLKQFKLADYFGNGWAKANLTGQNITWLPDYKSIFGFIEQGKADAVIVSRKAIYTMNDMGYMDNFIVFDTPLTSIDFHLCINKNSKYAGIIDEFDKILKAKQDQGVIDTIIESYY